jgi:hypothetical protein
MPGRGVGWTRPSLRFRIGVVPMGRPHACLAQSSAPVYATRRSLELMSWDISVFAAAEVPPPVAQMPEDWRGAILGSCEQVRDQISRVFADVDWSDSSWGTCDRKEFTLEFNLGKEDPVDGFMIHVRGRSSVVVKLLLEFAYGTGWYLLDCSEGEWFHHHRNPEASWHGFQKYRDRVLRSSSIR